MKCNVCGAELGVDEKICHGCGSPVEEGQQIPGQENGGQVAAETAEGSRDESRSDGHVPNEAPEGEGFGQVMAQVRQNEGEQTDMTAVQSFSQGAVAGQPENIQEPPKSGKKKGILIGVAAAAVVAAGALAFSFMGKKDPKEVVIDAFENVYTEDQVNPLEELFGLSQFAENARTADVEDSFSLILEDCSQAEVKAFAGSGLKVSGKSDRTNNKSSADIAVIYKDMELANINAYYGNDTLMMAIPQLSGKVFTVDISDGLAERIESSPLVGPALKEAGVDVDGLFGYFQEEIELAESGQSVMDFEALMTRFKEGTQAQEKFKEALEVKKGEKGTFTLDGEEVACSGYEVLVSKDSMMEFLRTSTDFFLNDQELKDQFLRQLEQSVKITELMGGMTAGISADQMYADSMEEITKAVDEMIDYLDQSLNNVTMTVYVDKKGRLAAVDGTTQLSVEESGVSGNIQVAFKARLEGGSYLTQNATAEVVLGQDGEEITMSLVKSGTYDGKQLTGDAAFDISLDGSEQYSAGVTCTGTYNSDGGDYHMGMAVTGDNSLILDLSMSGVVDRLEKGTAIHADIDELKITVMDAMTQVSLGGEYSYDQLSGEVKEPEGEAFDVLAADENDWESVFMEVYMNVLQLASQLSF